MRSLQSLRRSRRGASMVEYSLLIIGIMFAAAGMYKTLGKQVRKNGDVAWAELANHERAK